MYEISLNELSVDFLSQLYGTLDSNLSVVEEVFSVTVLCRDGGLTVRGENEEEVKQAAAKARLAMN